MAFYRYDPHPALKNLIECYWLVKDNDPTPTLQKIIPDGFPEVIFHFGDPYKIKLHDHWELQDKKLFAGQISKFFYLENTGKSNIVGIKFKPAALTHLFNIQMAGFTDKVVALSLIPNDPFAQLGTDLGRTEDHDQIVTILDGHLKRLNTSSPKENVVDKVLAIIFETHGMSSIGDLCEKTNISERQLERLFKKYIGLSPKFYSRIIRFNYIFQSMEEKVLSWAGLGLHAGFYDQPHFIKNFKAFTGEDPSKYFFDQPNLANFFLKKS
jgi:AraC-like DNA-binding protein